MKTPSIKKGKRAGEIQQLKQAVVGERNLNRTLLTHILVLVKNPDSKEADDIREYYKTKVANAASKPDSSTIN